MVQKSPSTSADLRTPKVMFEKASTDRGAECTPAIAPEKKYFDLYSSLKGVRLSTMQ